jgi:uracil phosphoribosyltransferase
MERVQLVRHPAVADRLVRLRDAATPVPVFRRLIEEIGTFLAYEATHDLPVCEASFASPVAAGIGSRIAGPPVVAPILRAGLGLLPGFLAVIDEAVVAHLGFFRDPSTLAAVPYYANLPEHLDGVRTFALDPMLATGNSGTAALGVLHARGARSVTFLCVLASPTGIDRLQAAYPDVRIVTCAVDERLNDHGYIVPGLGDAGDRMFGSASSVPMGYRVGGA